MTSEIRLIHESQDTRLVRATTAGDALWLDKDELERAMGWLWKAEGLCRADTCMPIPRSTARQLVDGDRLDVAGMWRHAGWPVVHGRSKNLWVFGEGASHRAAALTSLDAPDFALPDLGGRMHRLSDYRGRKVFLVTWASWCGCRQDLPVWQALHEECKARGFTVLAVALDQPDAARPFLEAASASYPCLIDRDHLTAELYNLVNVPQAVWVDETGHMVRPPEAAGMTDAFRGMDRTTFTMPETARKARDRVRAAYFDAVRDWALLGAASLYVLDAEAATARLAVPAPAIAEAHAHFRLGQALLRDGHGDEAAAELAQATRLHPASWAMWRQTAEKSASGLAVGEAFWQRVDALGDRPYYAPVDLARPSKQRAS